MLYKCLITFTKEPVPQIIWVMKRRPDNDSKYTVVSNLAVTVYLSIPSTLGNFSLPGWKNKP